jgi:hypothetical protein
MRRTRACTLSGTLIVFLALVFLPFSTADANVTPHGASSLATPHLYVDFWGPQWGTGFSTGNYDSFEYAAYLINFLGSLSADPGPLNPLKQYGMQSAAGLYAGSWTDTANNPPARPTINDFGAEVSRAAEHFGDAGAGQDVNDIILVAVPTGHDPSSFPSNGGTACAYHAYSQFTFGGLGPTPWIALPFQPDSVNCFENSANLTDNIDGNGYFDGVSKLALHEIAETISDYDSYGWYQQNTAGEVGDLCNNLVSDFGAPNFGTYFAVQPLWSNSASGCAYGTQGTIALGGNGAFGSQQIYTAAPGQPVIATNNGDADVYTGPGSPWVLTDSSQSYSLSGNTCPPVLLPSESCQVTVQFAPHLFGPANATLRFQSASFPLTGTGDLGEVLHTNFAIRFGSIGMLGPHIIRTAVVVNEGKSVATFKPAFLSGIDAADFSVLKDGCASASLSFGGSCSLQLQFAPTGTGVRTAELVLPSSQGLLGGIAEGFGTGPVATVTHKNLQAGVLSFGQTDGLAQRPTQSVSIKDTGQAALTISRISASGPFRQANDCPKILRVGQSCTIGVQLHPRHYNWQAGTLTIAENGDPTPRTIALAGSVDGTWAATNPGSVRFGSVAVGAASRKSIQLLGLESGPFRVLSVRASGGFRITDKCPPIMTAPACTITVSIRPEKAGKFSGILTIITSAADRTVRVPLSAFAPRA